MLESLDQGISSGDERVIVRGPKREKAKKVTKRGFRSSEHARNIPDRRLP
jgi:hypothetical protein